MRGDLGHFLSMARVNMQCEVIWAILPRSPSGSAHVGCWPSTSTASDCAAWSRGTGDKRVQRRLEEEERRQRRQDQDSAATRREWRRAGTRCSGSCTACDETGRCREGGARSDGTTVMEPQEHSVDRTARNAAPRQEGLQHARCSLVVMALKGSLCMTS